MTRDAQLAAVVQRECDQLPCLHGYDPREGVKVFGPQVPPGQIKWKGTVYCWIPNSVLPLQELFREVAHFPRKG